MTETEAIAPPEGSPRWRGAVIYQVHPRSFADSDGDDVGDLAGLRARLGHIAGLGVDGLWLWPVFKGRDGCRTPMPWDEPRTLPGYGWLTLPPAPMAP